MEGAPAPEPHVILDENPLPILLRQIGTASGEASLGISRFLRTSAEEDRALSEREKVILKSNAAMELGLQTVVVQVKTLLGPKKP
jgi:hypothetical protein